jgi:hypothetical protein
MLQTLDYKIKNIVCDNKKVNITTNEKKYTFSQDSLIYLHNSIVDSPNGYLFPTVFIKFYIYDRSIYSKLLYSPEELYNLRIWSVVYKDMHEENPFNTQLYYLAMKITDLTMKNDFYLRAN